MLLTYVRLGTRLVLIHCYSNNFRTASSRHIIVCNLAKLDKREVNSDKQKKKKLIII